MRARPVFRLPAVCWAYFAALAAGALWLLVGCSGAPTAPTRRIAPPRAPTPVPWLLVPTPR